ncbi:MAG: hypothetical protein PGN22_15585 [Agrobacterium cavarae]
MDYRFSERRRAPPATPVETPVNAGGQLIVRTEKRPEDHDIFWCNLQQGFAISSIEAIDDFGGDISVTLKSGRKVTVDSRDRDRFLARIPASPAWNR